MQASAWTNGDGTYGIRIGVPNRDEHFDRTWTEIEVEIDGPELRADLGLAKVPHYSTLCFAEQRLLKKGASAGSCAAPSAAPGCAA
jgi:hypothetical protein